MISGPFDKVIHFSFSKPFLLCNDSYVEKRMARDYYFVRKVI